MIESPQNQHIKYIKKIKSSRKFRHTEKTFLIEGENWLHEAMATPDELKAIFYTEEWVNQEKNQSLLQGSTAFQYVVSDAVMKAISDTTSPPGIAALIKQPNFQLPKDLLFILVLDGISDPGNLGTIVRTAAAAGIDALFLSPNCVDIYNPKVVRSCVGTLLKLPFLQTSWERIKEFTTQVPIYGLDAQANQTYTAVNWQKPSALMVGNESKGLSKEGRELLSSTISIPMARNVESLNASMAAGIVLFEALRQKGLN